MKVFGKKLLICLLVFVLLFNFTFQPTVQASVGDTISGILDVVGGIADGIAGILTYPIKIMIMIGESAILGLLTGIAVTFGYVNEYGEIADSSGNAIDHNITFFTPDVIFFNKILLTDANIFNIDEGMPPTIKEMRTNIALWYYIMRIIAISILLAILIFIAIRMAISTVASDKAKYKEMLVHWASSIALVFILHYVIVIVCNLNSSLVKILHSIYTSGGPDSLETGIGTLLSNTLAISFTASWSSLIVVGMIIIQTLAFLVYYIKRMLTLSFLVIISPLITITYSIDKLGDGKAQALNTWLKEFFFTIIIQPFHCIIYMVFLSMAISALNLGTTGGDIAESVFGSGFGIDSLIGGILAILCIKFVWDAEKIVKNIFGIRVSESLGDAVASAAVAGAVVSKGMGMAKGAAGAAKGAKNLAVKSGLADKLGNTAIGKKVSNLGKGMTVDGKLANVQNKLAAERAKGNATDWSKVNALEDKQRRLKDIQAGKGIRGKSYKAGKSIKGAAGSVKTGVGKVMNSEGGQIFKRYVASSAGVAAAVMGSSMTYGASDKTSLFEAGVAGIGAYTGIKGGVLGLMNRKKENYMDQTQSNAAVVCNATGKDPATMTSADVARMAMNATVKDSMGDFKNLKDDRGKAEKNIIAALQDKDRAQLKRDNPNLSDDEIDDAIANKDYKSVAANVMQDIDNGIYFKNLDCDKIAANYNLEPSALRGAAGDYAEARALKNMATDNANLDVMQQYYKLLQEKLLLNL